MFEIFLNKTNTGFSVSVWLKNDWRTKVSQVWVYRLCNTCKVKSAVHARDVNIIGLVFICFRF